MTSEPPIFRRERGKGIGKTGRVSEARLSRRLGLQQTPASGAMEGAKGDLRGRDWLLEAKSTVHDTLGVQREWLAKISGEAARAGKFPALSLSFVGPDGRAHRDGEWVAIPAWLFEEVLKEGQK